MKNKTETNEVFMNRIVGTGEEDLDQILFNPENWRVHPKQQQDALKKTLKKVGYVQPVLINQNTGHLVDGHLRCQLSAREGQKKIPAIYLDLTEEEERIILMSLDPIGEMATTDKIKLNDLLHQIQTQDTEINQLMKMISDKRYLEYGKTIQEDPGDLISLAEQLRKKWKTDTGQTWLLGTHRLHCGDCTDTMDVARLFQGEEADCIVTDPPYGVSYDTSYHISGLQHEQIQNDDLRNYALEKLLIDFLVNARLKQHNTIYIFFADRTMIHLLKAAEQAGVKHSQTLVWIKDQLVPNRLDYNYMHEPIFYGWRGQHTFYGSTGSIAKIDDPVSDEELANKIKALSKKELQEVVMELMITYSTVQRCERPTKSELHPTMKPVRLVRKLIQDGSPRYGSVYDPFSGSGTSIIAANQVDRRCFAMEKDPKYVGATLERWFIMTGGEPIKEQ